MSLWFLEKGRAAKEIILPWFKAYSRLLLCSLPFLLLLPFLALAAENNLTPRMTVKEEFNDNIHFSSSTPTSAYMTVFSPDFDLVSNTETLRLFLNVGMDAYLYLDDHQGQTTSINHSYRGDARLKATERLDLGGSLAYRVSNQPDQALEQNGLVLNSTRRSRQNYAADAGYSLTELATCNMNYGYIRDEYNNPDLIDTTQHSAGLRLNYDISRWLSPAQAIIEIDGSHYTNRDGWTRNISAMTGCLWKFSETFSATGLFGGSYTQSENTATVMDMNPLPVVREVKTKTDGNGLVGSMTLNRTGELTQMNLKVSHDVTVSAGRSGPTNTTLISGDISYQATADLSFRGSSSYQWDQASFSQSPGSDFTQETLQLSTGLEYKFTKDMNLNARYSYTALVNRQSGIEVNRNVIFVGFTWKYPLFE